MTVWGGRRYGRTLTQHQRMLETRRQLIEAEMARAEQEIVLQQQRADSAAKTLARYKSLREQGFVSEFQLTQYENDYNDQLARRQALERAKLTSTRDLLQAKEEAEQVSGQIRLNTAQNEGTLASLDQEAAEHQGRSRIQVLATADGTVTALTARHRGQWCCQGQLQQRIRRLMSVLAPM